MRVPATLFHGMPRPAEGSGIQPRTNYGTRLDDRTCAALGIAPGAKPPLVFATPHPAHAACFATTGRPATPLLFGNYDARREAYFAIFANRDAFMQATLAGAIYAFPSDGFVSMNLPVDNHYVALAEVPFERTRKHAEIRSAEDAMRQGVQIFTFANPTPMTPSEPGLPDMRHLRRLKDLAPQVASGEVVWENEARGVNPDPALRDILKPAR